MTAGRALPPVGSRWSVGDKDDLLLRGAIGDFCNGFYGSYPADSKRHLLLDSRFRHGVLDEAKPLVPKWKFSEDFDRDPLLLGVPGYRVIDLRTGVLRTMQRHDHITKRTRIAPDSNCKADRFLRFMDEITCGDRELAAYLMRSAATSLPGPQKRNAYPSGTATAQTARGHCLTSSTTSLALSMALCCVCQTSAGRKKRTIANAG